MTDNPENRLTFDAEAMARLDDPNAITFLTGKAGSGKSTLVRHWLATSAPANTLVAAPTGIAALNVNGITLHHLIHAKPGITPDEAEKLGRRWEGAPYDMLGALVVDEISMVRADLMDCLDRFLKAARSSTLPFGGLKLVLVGDLAQLPPVVTREDAKAFDGSIWPGPWFFQSHAMEEVMKGRDVGLRGIELTEIHRQSDPVFISALNALRDGRPSSDALSVVNARVKPMSPDCGIVLAATNRRADVINAAMLQRLPGPSDTFTAEIGGEWAKSLRPAPERLEARPGMRVMMLTNDSGGLWANGSMGELLHVEDGVAEIRLDDGSVIEVGRHSWEVTRPVVREIEADDGDGGARRRKRLDSVVIGSYRQMPFAPGWAVTIHKSQGKSFERCRIELPPGPLFAAGQAYVALSRATGLSGLTLSRPLHARDVIADPAALCFLEELRKGFPQPAVQDELF